AKDSRMKFLHLLKSQCSRIASLFLVWSAFAACAANSSANWPQFRGPGSLGVAANPNLPEQWSTNENVAWTVNVPGRGWSSPIVWKERVFLTTVTSDSDMEAPK